MTMRTEDANEIVHGTVEHLRVRLAHRAIILSDSDLADVYSFLEQMLVIYTDDSANTGGDWDNA